MNSVVYKNHFANIVLCFKMGPLVLERKTMKNNRRQFLILSAAGAATLSLSNLVQAQAMVAETDPQAQALGYKADTTKVDTKKFPKHANEQKCSNCALFQAKGGNAGGCSLFAGKQVAANGWCSAWAKKA